MKDDILSTGALFLGGGAAGYALGRFVLGRLRDKAAPEAAKAPSSTAPAIPAPALARPAPMPDRPTRRRTPSPASDDDAAPISSPAQVEEPERPEDHRPSRRFDRIFDMYRESIPIEYLRALAKRESDMNPEERKGPAWGLMQIVEVVRKDYNRAHGTTHTRQDLLDPATNVAIACWLLRFIIAQYHKHQPDIPNLRADWDNPRFVELLTFGWNAGFSTSGGVLRVVRYLKDRGRTDITIDLVFKYARAAGAVRHLSNPRKLKWCKSVARLYERELAAREP